MLLNCTHSLHGPHGELSPSFPGVGDQAFIPSSEEGAIIWPQSEVSVLKLQRQRTRKFLGKLPPDT